MRILAVDDDPSVLQALLAALRQLPEHELRAATNGEQAYQAAVENGGFDLLVTDVVMEPMDGLSLRNALQEAFPNLRTIFISGYDLSDYAESIGETPVLAKPLDVAVLLETAQGELARTPAPEPVAAPVAAEPAPRAVPVAAPKAAPAPASAPRAVPAAPAAPRAVPVAKAATPVAVPRVRPVAPPATGPKAVPVAKGPTAAAAPKAVAAPVARPVPVAAPAAVPPATTPPAPALTEADALGLLGQTIGGYKIVSLLGKGRWGPVFAGVQVAINRRVGLKVLDPELAAEQDQRDRFIADARAKANVQHPSILSVYEAGSAEGWIFYTHEFVDGESLSEMASTGRKIDQPTAVKILRAVSEGLVYFEQSTVPHTPLDADSVYLAADGQPRLANLATQHSDSLTPTQVEIETLGRAVLAVLPMGPEITPGLRMLLGRTLRTNPSPIANWAGLLQGVKALEPKVVPVEAAKISAQDRAAVEAVERARQQQKRAFWINVGAMVSLLLLAAAALYFAVYRTNERTLTGQIHIPAGDFISGHGVQSHNEEFWIDKYETTIGQYANFVEYIEKNPNEEHSFDHPRQPRMLSHIPEYWAVYHGNAVNGTAAHSVPMSLNSPIMMVTWWDAYAYAKWKGRELPTELEWERAARGTRGLAFPWGEEPDAKLANTNSDYDPAHPGKKGGIDGFNFWGDVDKQKKDRSPDGAIGMEGNVSEWTASWNEGNRFPIIKGSNYSLPLMPLGDRIENHPASPGEEFIGFRTISRHAPEK